MPKKEDKMTRINITVPKDLLAKFKQYCEMECRPVSAQIQYMMKEALKQKGLYQEEFED